MVQHQMRSGTLTVSSTLETMMKRAQHSWSWRANAPGIAAALLLRIAPTPPLPSPYWNPRLCAAVVGMVGILVYHYLLLGWGQGESSVLVLELATLSLQVPSPPFAHALTLKAADPGPGWPAHQRPLLRPQRE